MESNNEILFISPDTFNYYESISNSFENKGYSVDWHNQLPGQNIFIRALSRFYPAIVAKLSNKYYENKIDWTKNYQIVLIIKGEAISSGLLEKMKRVFKDAKFVYYNWDSFKNVKGAIDKLHYFDRVFSFDLSDVKKYKKIEHLPLFYTSKYKAKDCATYENSYSGIFVGTVHSNRYPVIEKILDDVDSQIGLTSFRYYYFANRFVFLLKKIFFNDFRDVPYSKLTFTPLDTDTLIERVNSSLFVVDISHPNQTGLTMRTIEMLGLKKKLITNNKSVLEYDFYNENNIYVIGSNKCTLDDFLLKPYVDLAENIYNSYDIDNWVVRLIE